MVDQLDNIADTGREADIFPFLKRCALDIICGEWLLQCRFQLKPEFRNCDGYSPKLADGRKHRVLRCRSHDNLHYDGVFSVFILQFTAIKLSQSKDALVVVQAHLVCEWQRFPV